MMSHGLRVRQSFRVKTGASEVSGPGILGFWDSAPRPPKPLENPKSQADRALAAETAAAAEVQKSLQLQEEAGCPSRNLFGVQRAPWQLPERSQALDSPDPQNPARNELSTRCPKKQSPRTTAEAGRAV